MRTYIDLAGSQQTIILNRKGFVSSWATRRCNVPGSLYSLRLCETVFPASSREVILCVFKEAYIECPKIHFDATQNVRTRFGVEVVWVAHEVGDFARVAMQFD
jgi:hypothetical protein